MNLKSKDLCSDLNPDTQKTRWLEECQVSVNSPKKRDYKMTGVENSGNSKKTSGRQGVKVREG